MPAQITLRHIQRQCIVKNALQIIHFNILSGTFLFEEIEPESDLTEDNNLVCSISKEEAVNLAIRLLKLSTERVPENGMSLHNFSGHDFFVHHTKEDDVHIDEPIFEIGNLEAEDIAEDGTISVCLTNESAKELIKALAKIV